MASADRAGGSILLLSLVLLAGLVTTPAEAASCAPMRPELTRGFALTGWFDGRSPREPDFAVLRSLRARGFLHVRLPVLAESVMARFSGAEKMRKTRKELTAAIDRLTEIGFAVVVDMHGSGDLAALFKKDPNAARDEVIAAWTFLAPTMRPRAAKAVMAEVLNEPPVADEVWAEMQPRIVAAMRALLPATTFIVSTGGPQRIDRLTRAEAIADADTVYAVHYYDPMVFTHQGASWVRPDPIGWLTGIPFPILLDDPRLKKIAASMRAAKRPDVAAYVESLRNRSFGLTDIRRDMNALRDWSVANKRQVVIGEFGVYRDAVSLVDRARWLAAVTRAANDACIGWTHWEYRDGFGLLDSRSGRPDEGTLTALSGISGKDGPPPSR